MEVRAKDLNQDVASRKQVNAKEYVQSTPVRQIASISRLQKTGRKRTFTPTRMRNEINKYLSWCEENDRVPSIKGLMIHLKMHKSQFYTYCEYPEFTDLMEQARELATHAAEIKHLQADMDKLVSDMDQIKATLLEVQKTLAEAKGGWRVLMMLGGAGAVIGSLITQIVHYWANK